MSLADIKLIGDTGWRAEPRYAPQDVLDSDGTTMHALSSPSNRRTIMGHLLNLGADGAQNAYDAIVTTANARAVTTYGGEQVYILSVVGQRLQNIGDDDVWRVTVELQKYHA